ncbi:MAG: nucleoside recognition domain-containing protein [Oscillospiraceae bacterium]|nr:nucleoside recognition domain-containing protein [Oscillospiraceae bacterium]
MGKDDAAVMMTWIFCAMAALSLVFGLMNGRMGQVSAAALEGSSAAVTLSLKLLGAMCLWSGLMEVAERSRLTEKLSRLFTPVFRLLFHGLSPSSPAGRAIAMNVAANLLGLGNAATPLGLAAMRELAAQEPCHGAASDHMVLFVVLNTASLQLIPTTTAALRLAAGSSSPFEILPAVWCSSLCSVSAALLAAKLFQRFGRGRHGLDR